MKKIVFIIGMVMMWGYCHAQDDVTLTLNSDRSAVMSNGLLTVSFNKNGNVSAITTADGTAVMTTSQSGYFSFDYRSSTSGSTTYVEPAASTVEKVKETADMVEIRYTNSSYLLGWSIGYIMRRGVSGIYAYAVVTGNESYNELHEARFVYRMNPDIFNYSWTSDDKQGTIPAPVYMRGWVEELQDATWKLLDGSTYTKYDWANFVKDDQLHGLMGDSYGVWLISPSAEWVNGGVTKQDLTTHATDSSPVVLQMLHSQHFGASVGTFDADEQKLFGPCLLYVNSGSSQEEMIADAKTRAVTEVAGWPYDWFDNDLFPKASDRGTVEGCIAIDGSFTTKKLQVVLGKPDVKPHQQGDGYQFWTETDDSGNFTIEDVRPGTYTLYAYALDGDALGTYASGSIEVQTGSNSLGTLTWRPTRYYEDLWQIGEADRTTAGFLNSDHQREYGLWKNAPANMTYTIGESDPANDWYYTQAVNGTWTVKFRCEESYTSPLYLHIATAGACGGVKLEVRMNANSPLRTITYANDAAVYRSATMAGRDSLIVIEVPAKQVVKGNNFLYLKLSNVPSSGQGGLMYDCIRLEAGTTTGILSPVRNDGDDDPDAPAYDLNGRRLSDGRLSKGIHIRNGRKYVVK